MAPRLAPTTADERDDETNALVEAVGGLNIFTTLARHPKALKRWLVFGGHVLSKNTLGDRERELLILRAGWRCGSEYEFGQHTIIGERVGLTPTEVARLTEADLDGWSADDALLRPGRRRTGGRPPHRRRDLGGPGGRAFDDQQLIDLLFTVGQYVLVSMTLNSLGVRARSRGARVADVSGARRSSTDGWRWSSVPARRPGRPSATAGPAPSCSPATGPRCCASTATWRRPRRRPP